jgi:hypothetical protein
MIIELQISEPWDLPAGLSPVIQLVVEEPQNDDDGWRVRVRYDTSHSEEAILRPRYEGQTLDELRSGQVRAVNLVIMHGHSGEEPRREMLVGLARRLEDED